MLDYRTVQEKLSAIIKLSARKRKCFTRTSKNSTSAFALKSPTPLSNISPVFLSAIQYSPDCLFPNTGWLKYLISSPEPCPPLFHFTLCFPAALVFLKYSTAPPPPSRSPHMVFNVFSFHIFLLYSVAMLSLSTGHLLTSSPRTRSFHLFFYPIGMK